MTPASRRLLALKLQRRRRERQDFYKDALDFAQRVQQKGGPDLHANGQFRPLLETAREFYAQAGEPVEFWPMLPGQNIGTGTALEGFGGTVATLAGGAAWGANGISMAASVHAYINLGPLEATSGTGQREVYFVNTDRDGNFSFAFAQGSTDPDCFQCYFKNNGLALTAYDGTAVEATTLGTWANPQHNFCGWDGSAIRIRAKNSLGDTTGFVTRATLNTPLVDATLGSRTYSPIDQGARAFAILVAFPKKLTTANQDAIMAAYRKNLGQSLALT